MWYLVWIGLLVIFVAVSIWVTMRWYGKKYILKVDELSEALQTVIVLGAGIRKDGKPCDLLADRLAIGAKAHMKAKCKNILLTGDNRADSRKEVDVMKLWIIDNYLKDEIDDNTIILDNKGFCTFDSMYRAKKIFNINKAIISTNTYHLPRAIYIARRMGIEAYGIASDIRIYDRMKKYKRRELLAQIKDFLLVNLYTISRLFKI